MSDEDLKVLTQEMQWIRKLMVMQVLATGYNQRQIASALGVSEATMSRMLPKGLSIAKK